MLDPNGVEVEAIVTRAVEMATGLVAIDCMDTDAAGAERATLVDNAFGMMRYAVRRSPTNDKALLYLAYFSLASGRSAIALQAANQYRERIHNGDDRAQIEMIAGQANLRLGDFADAIIAWRTASSSSNSIVHWNATLLLADALANHGQLLDALDVLRQAHEGAMLNSNEATTFGFALAVNYDRAEHHTDAFNALSKLQSAMGGDFGPQLQRMLCRYQLASTSSAAYYKALLYEITGYLSEARTEWLDYAADPDAPFAGRARQHADAIDRILSANLVARKINRGAKISTPPSIKIVPTRTQHLP